MRGEHSANHIAVLAAHLPPDALTRQAYDEDAAWDMHAILLAEIRNCFAGMLYGMSDKRKRGRRPQPVGPSWMRGGGKRQLTERVVTIDQLMHELSLPRR
jgi:hypothetical protein